MSSETLSEPLFKRSPTIYAHNREIVGLTEVFSPSKVSGRTTAERSVTPRTAQRNDRMDQLALRVSVVVNIAISIIKIVAVVISGSLAVTATLVDSVLDVVSQFILFYTDSASRQRDSALFPAGRTRLAPLGIFICAVIMGMASMEVIRESMVKLSEMWMNDTQFSESPSIVVNRVVIWAMGLSFFAKFGLYVYCTRVCSATGNDSVKAVALDHLNDILSIAAATLAAVTSFYSTSLGWVDPLSAIAISVYIIGEWWETAQEQANMLVGRAADDDFLQEVRAMGDAHHPEMKVDIIRAYHFGPKYLVELEVVLPPTMTLEMTHDIGMQLQHRIEAFDQVERAFVHIDYQARDYDEHNEDSWPHHYAERVKESIRKSIDV